MNNGNKQPATKVTVSAEGSSNFGKVRMNHDPSNRNLKEMWLAKIPNKLYSAWDAAKEGDVIGTITFTKAPSSTSVSMKKKGKAAGSKKNLLTIQVPDKKTTSNVNDDLPLDYTVEALTKKVPGRLHPFTRNDEDGSIDVHGMITRSCNLQVQAAQSKQYSQLLKNRLISTVHNARYVKPVDSSDVSLARDAAAAALEAKHLYVPTLTSSFTTDSGNTISASSHSFGDSIALYGKKAIEAAKEAAQASKQGAAGSKKRKFDAGQSLRSILFELYSTQQFWTVKEIRGACGYADTEIRQELQELCDYHKSGENRGSWELKTQYQVN